MCDDENGWVADGSGGCTAKCLLAERQDFDVGADSVFTNDYFDECWPATASNPVDLTALQGLSPAAGFGSMTGCTYDSTPGTAGGGYCFCDESNGWYQMFLVDSATLDETVTLANMLSGTALVGCIQAALKPGQ